jgi:molecular chaperone GrpE
MTDNDTRTSADEVDELRGVVADLEDKWKRAAADLDNVRKQLARDAERRVADERARVAREWLPVLDNLELALQHAAASPEAIVPGVEAVRELALSVLERLGYPRHDGIGEQFDPARHEAVSTVRDPEAPEGTVVHVVRPGYGEDERQLRPASVVVATRPD